MRITEKVEKFCQSLASGMTQADAYRSAYSAGNMKPETIYARAWELIKDGNVAARIAEIKKKLEDKQLWTREDSVKYLRKVLDEPEKPTDIVSAIKELNAMHGYNAPVKIEHGGSIISKIERVIVDDAKD